MKRALSMPFQLDRIETIQFINIIEMYYNVFSIVDRQRSSESFSCRLHFHETLNHFMFSLVRLDSHCTRINYGYWPRDGAKVPSRMRQTGRHSPQWIGRNSLIRLKLCSCALRLFSRVFLRRSMCASMRSLLPLNYFCPTQKRTPSADLRKPKEDIGKKSGKSVELSFHWQLHCCT